MKINFYYRFPSESLDACSLIAAERLFYFYQKEYPDIEFIRINYIKTENYDPNKSNEWSKFKHNDSSNAFVIIENDENKKYFVISYSDKLYKIMGEGDGSIEERCSWDMENCMEIFTPFGIHTEDLYYTTGKINYTPISYLQDRKRTEDRSQILYRLNIKKIIPNKPFFRSCGYLFRKYLHDTNDKRFDIRCDRVHIDEYINELSKLSINIDINSVAEISCRTADAFALGNALIRPKLTIKYHNELIPNYHYASIREISNNLKWRDYFADMADAYIEKFEEVKKDKDFVHFLSLNGRKWYEENGTIDAHVNILKKVIDLNKLL